MNPPEHCTQGFREASSAARSMLSRYGVADLSLSQPTWVREEKRWRFLIYTVGVATSVGVIEIEPHGRAVFMVTGDLLRNNIRRAKLQEEGNHWLYS